MSQLLRLTLTNAVLQSIPEISFIAELTLVPNIPVLAKAFPGSSVAAVVIPTAAARRQALQGGGVQKEPLGTNFAIFPDTVSPAIDTFPTHWVTLFGVPIAKTWHTM